MLFAGIDAPPMTSSARSSSDVRARGAGSEVVLACDMRFAARETAIFGQFEPAFGQIPGGGGAQYPRGLTLGSGAESIEPPRLETRWAPASADGDASARS